MKPFTDGLGQTQILTLDLFTVDMIRDLVKDRDGQPVDLLSILDEDFSSDDPRSLLYRLRTDRRMLCQVVHVAMNQSVPAGVTFDDFRKSMTGDGLDNAADALMQEIIDLFPRHQRETLRRLVQMHMELVERVQATARTTDQAIHRHLMTILDADPLGLSSDSSPENWDSTPAPSSSAN